MNPNFVLVKVTVDRIHSTIAFEIGYVKQESTYIATLSKALSPAEFLYFLKPTQYSSVSGGIGYCLKISRFLNQLNTVFYLSYSMSCNVFLWQNLERVVKIKVEQVVKTLWQHADHSNLQIFVCSRFSHICKTRLTCSRHSINIILHLFFNVCTLPSSASLFWLLDKNEHPSSRNLEPKSRRECESSHPALS